MYVSTRKLAQIAVLSVFTAALAACDVAVSGEGGLHFDAGGRAQDQWTRTYTLKAGARLELINVNGRITAEATDGNVVEVTGARTARAVSDDTAKDLLSRIEMREEAGDSRVRIEVRPPRLRRGSHSIEWTIKVPKGVAVDLRTVNGGVKVVGLEGEVRARATNGGITGERLASTTVDASVTNGGVEVALASAPTSGSIDLESVNGGVSLTLPAESKADIAARCVNGGISVNGLDVAVTGERTRRRLDGRLNGGGARVSLETVNGGVRISRSTT